MTSVLLLRLALAGPLMVLSFSFSGGRAGGRDGRTGGRDGRDGSAGGRVGGSHDKMNVTQITFAQPCARAY